MKDFLIAPLAGLWRALTAPVPQLGEWFELDYRWLALGTPHSGCVRVTIVCVTGEKLIGYSHRNSLHSFLETPRWHFHMLYRKIT